MGADKIYSVGQQLSLYLQQRENEVWGRFSWKQSALPIPFLEESCKQTIQEACDVMHSACSYPSPIPEQTHLYTNAS